MTENTIKTTKINNISDECEDIRTITFHLETSSKPKPGQFVMIWVPGIDEIPMSISNYDENGIWEITVKKIGDCTQALFKLKKGDYIGVRGPLGNYFIIPKEKDTRIILVGGGIGLAPLRFLSSELKKKEKEFQFIIGAKKVNELVFVDDPSNYLENHYYCTDDGSFGEKGYTSDIFEKIINEIPLKEYKNLVVYTCGPEIMMLKILNICIKNGIQLFASLERIMRCGCGLCGLCVLDPLGLLVCSDGPIFNRDTLIKIKDFGKKKRDFSGKKIKLGS
ncbi:MAG: dihydroorotate dehydrogenase electron transfer subunit [Candidatus Lokiarchaeota archaeon]|nr:dihydroorotate dehydrogenase electron transfer subunit [Candidatus Lokiarchaeota archaeon]